MARKAYEAEQARIVSIPVIPAPGIALPPPGVAFAPAIPMVRSGIVRYIIYLNIIVRGP